MKPYHPSGKIPSASYLKILLSAIIGGPAVGGLTYLVSHVFYIIFLFPVGMGFAGAVLMSMVVTGGKVRNPLVAGFTGLLTGFSIYGSMHYFDYMEFQNTARSEIIKEAKTRPELQEINPAIVTDEILQSRTKSTGFMGFVKYKTNGDLGTQIYWLLELGIIQGIVVYVALAGAKEPFCESSNDWYKSAENVGNVDPSAASIFLELLHSGRFAEAGTLVHRDPQLIKIRGNSLIVTKQVSPGDPQADVFLKISKAKPDGQGNFVPQDFMTGLLPTEDYQSFQQEFTTMATVVSADDQFGMHHLAVADLQQLVQILPNYPALQAAYLTSKVLADNTEQIFHVLGVICDLSLANTEAKQMNLVNDLTSEVQKIASFGEGKVLLLNNELKIMALIRTATDQPIYHK
jgi:hypothetical protein